MCEGSPRSHQLGSAAFEVLDDAVAVESSLVDELAVFVDPLPHDHRIDLGVELKTPGALTETPGLMCAVRRRGEQHRALGKGAHRVDVVLPYGAAVGND